MRPALTLLTVIAVAAPAAAETTPAQELASGRNLFMQRNFESALPVLSFLVHPKERLAQPDDLVETYIMVGACYVEKGQVEEARTEFMKALELMPDRRVLEGPLFSRTVVRVFDETRESINERNKRLEAARTLQQQIDDLENLKKSMIVVEDHPWSRNFAPFGAGQFQNGTPIRGILFATGQGLTLATSVGIYGYLVNKYGLTNSHVPLADGPSVRRLQQIEIVSGAMFIGLYAWSVIDSLRNYQARVKGEFDESLLTPAQRKLLHRKPAASPGPTSFHLTPMVSPDTVGIGLSWEN